MSAHDLLFELRTEELPPRTLLNLSSALTEGVLKGIDTAGIPHGKVRSFATPRRLAVHIQKLADHQPDRPSRIPSMRRAPLHRRPSRSPRIAACRWPN
jgi:glycyl-tRNA synthetase beta chain